MAKVIYVDDNATQGGDGSSWATAHKYLQDALAVAEYGDDIRVAEGTYKPDQGAGKTPGDRTTPFVLVNGVGMYGGFLGTETTRDPQGDNNQTILSGEISDDSELWSLNVVSGVNLDANTTLDGFRITKGNANGASGTVYRNGGGLWIKDSEFRISNCVFTNNSASSDGGGIYTSSYSPSSSLTLTNCVFTNNSASGGKGGGILSSSSSSLTLTNCVFTNNSAEYGGGIYSFSNSYPSLISLTLTNCVFTNNSAEYGGGIYSDRSSSLTLNNCVFTNNSAGFSGGGIYSDRSSSLTLNNCVFTNNIAVSDGGGISSSSNSSLTLTNCVFTNNIAGSDGGGINTNHSSSLILNSCEFTNNSAFSDGGGIYTNSSSSSLNNCVFTANTAPYGGGINTNHSSSLTLTNCLFTNNSASSDGGGIYTSSSYSSSLISLTLTNCVFTNNTAGYDGGGISSDRYSSLTLNNSILWKNSSYNIEGHGLNTDYISFKSILLQEAIEAQYPGDPNARDAVYEPDLNILLGWEGDARAFDADPLFVDIDNPAGPDGTWFTEDDGLRVTSGSPAIDAGYNDSLPPDTSDIDGDGNLTEVIPYDALHRSRVIGSRVDIGPYEFDPDNPPPVVKTLLTLSTTNGGAVTGGGYYDKGASATLEASPLSGYLFSNWSGDANGSSNPLSITMDLDKSITANFIQDSNDDDGDGLTNFAEFVTYGTDPSKQDTDGDGILDAKEIEIGTNPKVSDESLVSYVTNKVVADFTEQYLSDKNIYVDINSKIVGDGTAEKPFSNISDAIAKAEFGNTVLVAPGTYTENLTIGKNIIVASHHYTTGEGDHIDNTIINGGRSGSVVSFNNEVNGSALLTGFTITNGYAEDGGGIRCGNSSSPTLSNLIIKKNEADQWGGGIFFDVGSKAKVTQSLIVENSASGTNGNGGGIGAWGLLLNISVENSTIANNEAWESGSGIYVKDINPSGSNFSVTNSIIWNEKLTGHYLSGGMMYQELSSKEDRSSGTSDSNFVITSCLIRNGWSGTSITSSDPKFIDYANGDYRLSEDSPAIGLATSSPARDLNGNLRPSPQGTKPDLGVYEQGIFTLTDQEKALESAKAEGITEGKASVTNDPGSYSLVTKSAYDQALLDANQTAEQAIIDAKVSAKAEGITEGKASVTNDPGSYSLVTKSAYDQALLDANQTAEQAIADASMLAKAEGITIGRLEGEQSVLGNPSAYNLFTSEQYEQALQSLDINATPYTPDWFYMPDRGWMWSQKGVYPWFYDANSSNWMYFKSGHDNPRFYNHGTKKWMTLD